MKLIESIAVGPSRAESKESAKVESIDRVGQKLPWIDRLARLDRFRGLPFSWRCIIKTVAIESDCVMY